jgi:hypothetical protein
MAAADRVWNKGLKDPYPKNCKLCKVELDKYRMNVGEYWICPECFAKCGNRVMK